MIAYKNLMQAALFSYEAEEGMIAIVETQLKALNIADGRACAPKTVYRGKGCSVCGMTGYKGRMGIYELLEVNGGIKKIIAGERFDLAGLREEVRKAGMKTMFEDGLGKVQVGLTTLEEVLRVIRE